jgi:hypothetical protein
MTIDPPDFPPTTPLSLRRVLVLGAVLVVVDAFVFNQGAIALLVGLGVVFVGLPHTLLARKYRGVRPQRLRHIGIYLLAVLMVFALNAANNSIAQSRAQALVVAVKAFKAQNQRYPNTLAELVPTHIESVPMAKFTWMFNQFTYWNNEVGTVLYYVAHPPLGRQSYVFSTDKWGFVD